MNERIRELHSQCKVCDKDTVLYFDYEKFAELIVRECIKAYNDDGYQTEYEQDQKVLKHFGVE
jgi:hypothetical protein